MQDTGSGLRAVDDIKRRLGADGAGIYGPLYRLLEIPDRKYATAIELTAGSSLFHVVVDTDQTAQKVLDIMLKERTGRVTFMPLNRLKPKEQQFPQGGDAVPLIDKLSFDPAVKKAVQQVFGRTAVCRDLTVAAAYVRSHGLNTITLDGDKVDRKGALTGGYVDVRRSRIDAARGVQTWQTRHGAEQTKLQECKARIATLEAATTKTQGEASKLNDSLTKLSKSGETIREELGFAQREAERLRDKARRAEAERVDVDSEAVAAKAKVESYKTEMKAPMEKRLTAEEEQTLERLAAEVEEGKTKLTELKKTKSEVCCISHTVLSV